MANGYSALDYVLAGLEGAGRGYQQYSARRAEEEERAEEQRRYEARLASDKMDRAIRLAELGGAFGEMPTAPVADFRLRDRAPQAERPDISLREAGIGPAPGQTFAARALESVDETTARARRALAPRAPMGAGGGVGMPSRPRPALDALEMVETQKQMPETYRYQDVGGAYITRPEIRRQEEEARVREEEDRKRRQELEDRSNRAQQLVEATRGTANPLTLQQAELVVDKMPIGLFEPPRPAPAQAGARESDAAKSREGRAYLENFNRLPPAEQEEFRGIFASMQGNAPTRDVGLIAYDAMQMMEDMVQARRSRILAEPREDNARSDGGRRTFMAPTGGGPAAPNAQQSLEASIRGMTDEEIEARIRALGGR